MHNAAFPVIRLLLIERRFRIKVINTAVFGASCVYISCCGPQRIQVQIFVNIRHIGVVVLIRMSALGIYLFVYPELIHIPRHCIRNASDIHIVLICFQIGYRFGCVNCNIFTVRTFQYNRRTLHAVIFKCNGFAVISRMYYNRIACVCNRRCGIDCFVRHIFASGV